MVAVGDAGGAAAVALELAAGRRGGFCLGAGGWVKTVSKRRGFGVFVVRFLVAVVGGTFGNGQQNVVGVLAAVFVVCFRAGSRTGDFVKTVSKTRRRRFC